MKAERIWFDEKYAYLRTDDGRTGKLLLVRSPRLARASVEQLRNFRLMRDGIHWPDVDEDIAFTSFFEEQGEHSGINLGAIPEYLSISYLAQRFFGKSRSWLHNKLHGNLCNGKPATLSTEEKNNLKSALLNLSKELEEVAMGIK